MSASPFSFVVPGAPVGKERPRVVKGRAFTPAKTRDYERRVQMACRLAGWRGEPWLGPVSVTLEVWHEDARRRDLDNAVKSITDALNGLAYDDDAQVVELHATKGIDRHAPRAVVRLERLALGCPNCLSGSLDHPTRCDCTCHVPEVG